MDLTTVIIFLLNFITILGNILTYAIFARIILSWINLGSMKAPGKITYFINDVTEPILKIARKFPHRIGMIDLSPFIAMLLINIAVYVVVKGVSMIGFYFNL